MHFFQSKLLGSGGYFHNRLKYLKRKRGEFDLPDVDEVSDRLNDLQMSPEDALERLKSCIIKKTDPTVIIAWLKSTQKLREDMLRDENIDLRTSFPFFMSNPELVNRIICLQFYLQ